MEISPDIFNSLACPDCKKDVIKKDDKALQCVGCEREFDVTKDRIISMLPSEPFPLPEMYSDPDYIETMQRFHEIMTYSYESKSIVGYVNNAYHKI